MDIVIIDGQGGGFGRALIEALRAGGVTQAVSYTHLTLPTN